MSNYSIYFPALSQVSPTPTDTFRICTKTTNTYNSNLSCEIVFRYYDNPSTFDLSGNRMTIFHIGTDASKTGIAIILTKSGSAFNLGLITSTTNGTWTNLAGSFVNLNSIGNVSTDAFYLMLTYSASGSSFTINFYVVQFNSVTTKTAPDFSFSVADGNISPGGQWGFGSSPEAIGSTGYISNPASYNCYISQNLELSFLRTWNVTLPSTSTSSGQYAMFNTVSSHSLYGLNKSFTQVPSATTNLNFQLNITANSWSNVYNTAAATPGTLITGTNSPSGFPTLPGFGYNNSTSFMTTQTTQIPCLLKGTKILTPTGYKLIEHLKIGDLIMTHDNRPVKIKKIMHEDVYAINEMPPLLIRKGKFGAFEDLYISRWHCILINNKYFVETHKLTNIETKYTEFITYYHIQLENFYTDTLVANGVAVECWSGWQAGDPDDRDEKYMEDGLRILARESEFSHETTVLQTKINNRMQNMPSLSLLPKNMAKINMI